MKQSRLITSLLMLLCSLQITAGDSIYVQQSHESKYDMRIRRYRKHWAGLIPTQFVIQNAGNMGLLSAGLGWNYGSRRQWETDLMVGFIPKHQSTRTKMTMTLKENYIPWSITPRADFNKQKMLSVEPLTVSIYINTVYGDEFWKNQPNRYPDKYYEFMSTKFRLNLALGQRFTVNIPEKMRVRHSRVSLFYEVSSCDLYIRSMFQDSSIKLKDIIGLSLGIKLQTL